MSRATAVPPRERVRDSAQHQEPQQRRRKAVISMHQRYHNSSNSRYRHSATSNQSDSHNISNDNNNVHHHSSSSYYLQRRRNSTNGIIGGPVAPSSSSPSPSLSYRKVTKAPATTRPTPTVSSGTDKMMLFKSSRSVTSVGNARQTQSSTLPSYYHQPNASASSTSSFGNRPYRQRLSPTPAVLSSSTSNNNNRNNNFQSEQPLRQQQQQQQQQIVLSCGGITGPSDMASTKRSFFARATTWIMLLFVIAVLLVGHEHYHPGTLSLVWPFSFGTSASSLITGPYVPSRYTVRQRSHPTNREQQALSKLVLSIEKALYETVHEDIRDSLVQRLRKVMDQWQPDAAVHQALYWMATKDKYDNPITAQKKNTDNNNNNSIMDDDAANAVQQVSLLQRYATTVLYFHMDANEAWTQCGGGGVADDDNNQKALSNTAKRSSSCDSVAVLSNSHSVCDWHGITCNDQQLVTKLDWSGNNLSTHDDPVSKKQPYPSFPDELLLLCQSLQSLSLSDNPRLSISSIPGWIHELPQLQTIHLYNTGLHGTVPDRLWSGLSQLSSLRLGDAHLTGTLPSSIYHPRQTLQTLELHNNDLTGQLPTEIGYLMELKTLAGMCLTVFCVCMCMYVQRWHHVCTDRFTYSLSHSLYSIPFPPNTVLHTPRLSSVHGNPWDGKTSATTSHHICELREHHLAQFVTDCDPADDYSCTCCTKCFVQNNGNSETDTDSHQAGDEDQHASSLLE